MLKKIIIGLGALAVLILIAGLLIPKEVSIEREITIDRPKDFVFGQLKFIKNHNLWNPWIQKDPTIAREYIGTDGTVGFVAGWAGNSNSGVGEQEIKSIVEGERLDFELRFKEPFEGIDSSYLITETAGNNQTKVKWGFKGHMSFPLNIMCFFMGMNKMLEKDYDTGLNSLKTVLEASATH